MRGGRVSVEQLWCEQIEQQFPKKQIPDSSVNALEKLPQFVEDKVDAMRKQKDEDLEHYKKEIERAKRYEQQKAESKLQNSAAKKKISVVKP